jgi:hypothetical protein
MALKRIKPSTFVRHARKFVGGQIRGNKLCGRIQSIEKDGDILKIKCTWVAKLRLHRVKVPWKLLKGPHCIEILLQERQYAFQGGRDGKAGPYQLEAIDILMPIITGGGEEYSFLHKGSRSVNWVRQSQIER